MNNRHEEIRCYECGRLKTGLIWKSRCVTCTVQRLESNLEENDTLRDENAALEARVAELEDNYNDLLMCVQNKIPGVTRHDRAKQCILNWEAGTSSSQHREECTKGANQ